MKWHLTLFIWSAFAIVASAAPANLLALSNITIPTEDPFYQPRAGFENLKLGEVIDYRKVPNPIGIIVFTANIQAAYQFLVRSQDSHGNANAIVTTLLVPHNADPKKVLSYQTAEDAATINCAPSYSMQLGSESAAWVTPQVEQAFSHAGLYEGWYVVVPDHNGPKSAWLAGHQAAYAVLDSLKAVLSSGDLTGVDQNASVALWGYSGGTQPSTWGASIASTYAPDIDIIGVAVGGIVVDLESVIGASDGSISAGLIVTMFNGLAHEYPEFNDYLHETLYPEIQPSFFRSTNSCLLAQSVEHLFMKLSDISSEGADIVNASVVKQVLSQNNLLNLNSTPKAPFFFYNGIYDEIVPSNSTDLLYSKWCKAGVSIEYRQDKLSEHISEVILGAGDAFSWLKDRFSGVPQSGCTKINSFSNALNFDAIPGFYAMFEEFKTLVEGGSIGPSKPASNSTSSTSTGSTSIFSTLLSLIF